MSKEQLEKKICAAICQGNGLKAKDIARQLNLDRSMVNRVLYASPLLKDLCYQDDSYRWHGIIRQSVPHDGLFEFSGYYAKVSDFLKLTEDEWMDELTKGCQRIGRNLNDTRGLLHSFRDCREQMINLFADLRDMLGDSFLDWEIVFEFRLKRGRYVRIYADVLVITENKVFSLEFKMKDKLDSGEVSQAAKYVPYLEIVFGTDYEIIPALVLTAVKDYFDFVAIGKSDSILPVCSGDMLFNVFDEYLGYGAVYSGTHCACCVCRQRCRRRTHRIARAVV